MKKILTFDVGGTFIKYGLIDDNFEISSKGKIKTPYDSTDCFLETLKEVYLQFQNEIEEIAISAPGRISEEGQLLSSGALIYLEGLELAKELSARCGGIHVTVENDGKAAALCEAYLGSAKDYQNSVALIFGTGIGGGVIIDKKVFRGNFLIAGEFSPVFSDYKMDSYDVLASQYSTITVVEKVKKALNDETITGEAMMSMYEKNSHQVVTDILNEWFHAIAKLCYNIDCLYNPDVICIGGGISANPLFVEKIKEYIGVIAQKAYTFRQPPVVACQYHNDSNLLGAYSRYIQKFGK